MEILRQGDTGYGVLSAQKKLGRLGFKMKADGIFGSTMSRSVQDFQKRENLTVDGVIGPKTWQRILTKIYSFSFSKGIINEYLPVEEYIPELVDKRTIYLHHTAGWHNPHGVRRWWEVDKIELGVPQRRVGTAFIIGRRDDMGKGDEFDGKILRVFDEKYWAYHLGLKTTSNRTLNASAIGIEICNLGPLEEKNGDFVKVWRNEDGKVDKEVIVPESEVYDLGKEWRGFRFFHKYTEKQLQACKWLVLTLAHPNLYDIPVSDTYYDREWFRLQPEALAGRPGIWTHSNVREDKTDCFPQAELIEMLNTLHQEHEIFEPDLNDDLNTIAIDGAKELSYYYNRLD